ncbi:MAG: SpoIIE family protein phosphatase [Oscillospiraceae bacterium]
MNRFYMDLSWNSLNKQGEALCGDRVQIIRKTEDESMVMVLADGLGSGVKANILSTLTSKIISTMMANEMSVEQCVKAIANTLPVCEERQIAYSTFTIIKVDKHMCAHIIEFDNPQTIFLREGKNYDYPKSTGEISGKTIVQSKVQLMENDLLISMSDGALYASDNEFFDMKNWNRESVIRYVEKIYHSQASAQMIQSNLLDKINTLYGKNPTDDVTVSVLKVKKRLSVDVAVGPPLKEQDDQLMLSLFFSKRGEKIVCGGTTAQIVAKYLDKPIILQDKQEIGSDVPPMSQIEGVTLVTEGIITLNRVLKYVTDWQQSPQPLPEYSYKSDGAALMAQMLIDKATDINFFVGRAVNSAHSQDMDFVELGIKHNLVDRLCQSLKSMDKSVKVYEF